MASDGADVTCNGREFQVRAAATWNARSPTVERHIDGMISSSVDADRSRRLESMSATRRKLSARYDSVRHFGIADGLMSRLQSSSKRRRTSQHLSQAVRAHHASPTSAALAATPQTSGFQDIHPCLSFVGWHRSCVPSWWMYTGYCHWPPSSVVCLRSNVLGQEIMQPVRCHYRTNAVQQSAWTASATRHHLRTIRTIVENIYVWLAEPRRPVSER